MNAHTAVRKKKVSVHVFLSFPTIHTPLRFPHRGVGPAREPHHARRVTPVHNEKRGAGLPVQFAVRVGSVGNRFLGEPSRTGASFGILLSLPSQTCHRGTVRTALPSTFEIVRAPLGPCVGVHAREPLLVAARLRSTCSRATRLRRLHPKTTRHQAREPRDHAAPSERRITTRRRLSGGVRPTGGQRPSLRGAISASVQGAISARVLRHRLRSPPTTGNR